MRVKVVLNEGSRPDEIGYHFTDLKGLAGILKSNCLLATNKEDNPPTISYTRKSDGMYYRNMVKNDSIRIVLDIDKISEHYKIFPFSWSHVTKNAGDFEFEERIEGKKLSNGMYGLANVSDYIKEITLTSFMEKALGKEPIAEMSSEIITEFNYTRERKSLEYELKQYANRIDYWKKKLFNKVDWKFLIQGSSKQIRDWLLAYAESIGITKYTNFSSGLVTFLIEDILRNDQLVQMNLALIEKQNFINSFRDNSVIKNVFAIADKSMNWDKAYIPVDDKTKQKYSREARKYLQEFKILTLKNGKPVTSLTTLKKYLNEKGIKLNFMGKSNNILGASFINASDIETSKRKLKYIISQGTKELIEVAKKVEVLCSDIEKELGSLLHVNMIPITPECYQGMKEAINILTEAYINEKFKQMGLTDSDKIRLIKPEHMTTQTQIPIKNSGGIVLSNNNSQLIKTASVSECLNKDNRKFFKNLDFKKTNPFITVSQLKQTILQIVRDTHEYDSDNTGYIHFYCDIYSGNTVKRYFIEFNTCFWDKSPSAYTLKEIIINKC